MVRALLEEYGLKPNQAYGQNFLVDSTIAERIVALLDERMSILGVREMQVTDDVADFLGIRPRGMHAVLRLAHL